MIDKITKWIDDYLDLNNIKSLVVGISGGIDSSVVSTLCARTNRPVYAVSMPLLQIQDQHDLSISHGLWLKKKFPNINHHIINLDDLYQKFYGLLIKDFSSKLAFANSKSRLRMVVLHQISASTNGIVVGTGNKVEDFGVGFFTKYGDGGVDISPIADLMKSEVWELGKQLGVPQEIIDAPPTDGLWEDGRTDLDQLGGLTYENMEDAMSNDKSPYFQEYSKIRNKNLHKMKPIPIFKKDQY